MATRSPKQLMLSAIRGEPVERIPAATYNFHPLDGFSQKPGYAPMVEALAQAKHVGILGKCGANLRQPGSDRSKVERQTVGDATLTITETETPKGTLRTVNKSPKGQPGYCVEPLIKDDHDIEKFLSLSSEPAVVDLSPAKEFYEKLGEKGIAYLGYSDPFYSIAYRFDFEDFAVRCLRELPRIQELVDREFRRIKAEVGMMLEQAEGYDFLFYCGGPEVATPPLLPPEIFRKLVTRYQKELVAMIKESGQLSCIHCHGKISAVFDEFLEIGIHALEPMEPPPQGDLELGEALDRAAGRMCLMGYIQDQDLYTAQPGEMSEKVRAICQIAKGRRYIMTPTATPFMSPPPEDFVRNYVEFIQAAEEYGSTS